MDRLYSILTIVLLSSTLAMAQLPGSGTEADPYRIESFDHFQQFADSDNSDTYWAAGVHTRLEVDIDLDPALPERVIYDTAVIAPDIDPDVQFKGIPFSAVLDGNGHTISNIKMEAGGNNCLGLFGMIDQNSQIRRLGIIDINIIGSPTHTGSVCGFNGHYYGGLGGLITDSYAVGGSIMGGTYTGGLCGVNAGAISNSYAAVNITKGGDSVGGLCGWNLGDISNSYSTGSVTAGFIIGGLCGNNYSSGTVQNCYSTGALVGTSTINERQLGGLCSTASTGVAINSYWDVSTSGVSVSGGGYPKSTTEMMIESTFAGWHDGSWVIDEGNDYPRLTWQGTTGAVIDYQYPKTYSGDGVATPFQLSDANDLISMSMRPEDWGGQFVLVQDIDMAGEASYRPIGYFTGVLDGAGYDIQNLTVTGGMFIQIAPGSEVKNIGLTDVSAVDNNTSGTAGALCVRNSGTISNCFVSGIVHGENVAGGLCGYNYGDIRSSFSMCSVSGGNLTGGFCGYNVGNIQNCYSMGAVSGANSTGGFCGLNAGNIQNCYSTGAVSGGTNVGGFCGYDNGTTVNCFWDVNSSGQTDSSGGTAKTTEDMHNINTYLDAGWNFSIIWLDPNPSSNDGYPSLQQRVYPYDIAVQAIITHVNPIISPSSSPVLPGSDTNMPAVGEPFYLEVWATDVCDPSTGLTGVYVDVNYNDSVEVLSINHSSPFTFLATGAIDGSSVVNFGGAALPHGGGICPEWVRIGWLESQISEEVSMVTYDLLPGATGVAALGRGLVEWYLVDLGSISLYRDCNGNGIPDMDDITSGTSQDCNGNGIPDECDIASGFSLDCNHNGIPDECDISSGVSRDCNGNGIPDECDIASGFSQDCNGNGIPDECDIASGTSTDENMDGVPDECQAQIGIVPVAVAEPPYYTADTRIALPESITAIGRSSKYYVEFWAQCFNADSNGLLGFSVDVLHDSFNSLLSLAHNTSLRQTQGQIFPGGIDEFGGEFALSEQGIAPEWVRLGWLEMRANLETDSSVISLLPGDEEISEYLIPQDLTSYVPLSYAKIQSNYSSANLPEGNDIPIDVWLSQPPLDPAIPIEVEAILSGNPNIVLQSNPVLIFDSNNWDQSQQIVLSAGHDMDLLDDSGVLILIERQDSLVVDTKAIPVQVNDDDFRIIPWEYVNLYDLDIEILPPLRSYDLDDDDSIGLGDLSFFVVSWQQDVPPGNELHDFDFDGFVGPGDLSWFVTGWNKSVDDMSIVYPPYDAGVKGASTLLQSPMFSLSMETEIPMASSQMPDVAVAITLTEAVSPSDFCTSLPDSVKSILAGNSYMLEFWVSDVGQINSGITSVYVNAEYPSEVFDVQSISYGSIFNLFVQGDFNEGLLENLGGSTLDPNVAVEPNWVRFGIVELAALYDEDMFSILLMPNQLGISAYGRGKVPWDFIHFIPVRSHAEGDFDGSGRVEMTDFAIMAYSWRTSIGDLLWNADCDLHKDGILDFLDLARFVEQWMNEQ